MCLVVISGVNPQQTPPPFTRTTKFNDLSEQIQKTLESIEYDLFPSALELLSCTHTHAYSTHIQGRIQICSDLKARSLNEEPTRGAELIRKVHNV
jgi:nucleoporin p58/p45